MTINKYSHALVAQKRVSYLKKPTPLVQDQYGAVLMVADDLVGDWYYISATDGVDQLLPSWMVDLGLYLRIQIVIQRQKDQLAYKKTWIST